VRSACTADALRAAYTAEALQAAIDALDLAAIDLDIRGIDDCE
jgi:hypothetical protein